MTDPPAQIWERVTPPYDFSTQTWDSLSRDVLAVVNVAKAARELVWFDPGDEHGPRLSADPVYWPEQKRLLAALSVLDDREAGEPRD